MSFKQRLRAILYSIGVFSTLHKLRNRNTVTVFMFHRVLPASSEAYKYAEKEFTFTVDGFGRCLDFISRHYKVISLEKLKSGIGKQAGPLALITFDDGWRDTLTYAQPELEKRAVPAVLFLSTETITLEEPHWWQDYLVELMAIPGNTEKLTLSLGLEIAKDKKSNISQLVSAKISELPNAERLKVLHQFLPPRELERQMLKASDITRLSPLIRVAGHGHTHGPMSVLLDPGRDLSDCQHFLQSIDADAETLSFPHGAYNQEVVSVARGCGFNVFFSSHPNLVGLSKTIHVNDILGRIHIPENQWTCDERGISYPKLATFLFFRPVA